MRLCYYTKGIGFCQGLFEIFFEIYEKRYSKKFLKKNFAFL